jgi:hypothetical protein
MRICLCSQMEPSRCKCPDSPLLLGYFPSEIVRLLGSTRAALDRLTKPARLEAKASLTWPGTLVFIQERPRNTPLFPSYLPDNPVELNVELRRRIFGETESSCLSPGEISNRYSDPSRSIFTTLELAHLVSCSSCLDRVNEVLKIPSLTVSMR